MIGILIIAGAILGAAIGGGILYLLINLSEDIGRWRLASGEAYDKAHKVCPKSEGGYHDWDFIVGPFGPKVVCQKCGERVRGRIL